LCQDPLDLLRLKVLGHRNVRAFGWDCEHALVLIGTREIVLQKVLEEATDRGPTDIATGRTVAPL
jgi:hypothetical protein